jgi:uncharacterized protein YjaZ
MAEVTLDNITKEMIEEFEDRAVATELLSSKLKEKIVMFRTVAQAEFLLKEKAESYDQYYKDGQFSQTVMDIWSDVEDQVYGLFDQEIRELERRAAQEQ